MDKATKKKLSHFEDAAAAAFDWKADIEKKCSIKMTRLSDKRGLRFTLFTKNPLTNKKPCFLVKGARLAPTGKSGEGRRGFFVGKGEHGPFNRLNVACAGEGFENMAQGISAYLDLLLRQYDPISRSLFYQNEFEVLDDGTKVYKATNWMNDCANLIGVNIEGEFDGPNRYARFLWGCPGENALYMNAGVPVSEELVLCCVDEKDKPIGVKKEEDTVVYPGRSGLSMNQTSGLQLFLMSDFYTKTMWTADFVVSLQSIDLKVGREMNAVDNSYFVYPKFNFGVISSIVLKKAVVDEDPNALKAPERTKFLSQLVFDGRPAPKRKSKPVEKDASEKKKPKVSEDTAEAIESEISECEGEEEE